MLALENVSKMTYDVARERIAENGTAGGPRAPTGAGFDYHPSP
jgi:hypothetical protein